MVLRRVNQLNKCSTFLHSQRRLYVPSSCVLSTGGSPPPGVPFLLAGVGVEVADAFGARFPERDGSKQKCRGGRRPNGVVGRGFHAERTSHRQRETEQQRRR